MTKTKTLTFTLLFLVGLTLWFLPHPEDIPETSWHLFAIFFTTILGIILKPLPIGAITLVGLTVTVVTKTLTFSQAFSGFNHPVVWLIVLAFFISRGFIKTGLGSRISYLFMLLLGRRKLGFAYGFILSDLILSPAIPSSTARSGGVIYPIIDSLSKVCKSLPHHPSSRRLGGFLISVAFHSTCITSAMFLTSMAANPLIAEIAEKFGVTLSWGTWALAAALPGLTSLIVMPLVVIALYPPTLEDTAEAAAFAKKKLTEMGKMSRDEWIMLGTFFLLITLWSLGATLAIQPATVALLGLTSLLLFGVIEWRDISHEGEAWETLIWFAILLTLALQMSEQGLTSWMSQGIVKQVSGFNGSLAFFILCLAYFYTHYFFASNLAHVSVMYSSFLAAAIAVGAPPLLAALILAFFSSLFGGLTHYACGPAAILFGAGYVPVGTWWKIGFFVTLVNIVIWLFLGGLWWKVLGIW